IRARHYTGGERTTVLIVASKLSSILLADRVMLLADGRIVEQGTHARLSTQSAAYRSLLGLDDGHRHDVAQARALGHRAGAAAGQGGTESRHVPSPVAAAASRASLRHRGGRAR